jgi:hypothetical protein
MALVNAILAQAPTDVFTCANAGGSAVVTIVITNGDSAAMQADVHACPGGETNSIDNLIFSKSIPPGDSFVFSEKLILANTDIIKVLIGDSSSDVSCTISYLDL